MKMNEQEKEEILTLISQTEDPGIEVSYVRRILLNEGLTQQEIDNFIDNYESYYPNEQI